MLLKAVHLSSRQFVFIRVHSWFVLITTMRPFLLAMNRRGRPMAGQTASLRIEGIIFEETDFCDQEEPQAAHVSA